MTTTDLPPTAVPPDFPNYEAFDAWRRACARESERFGPADKFRVAPSCSFPADPDLAPGVTLREGDEVRPFDHYVPAAIEALVNRGVIIRGTPGGELVELCPPDAKYVVARSVISASGQVLLPGAQIEPFFLRGGQADLDRLVASGAVIDRDPQPVEPTSPADRALVDAFAGLARADSDLASARAEWVADDSPASAKKVNRAEEIVKRAHLLIAAARHQQVAEAKAEELAQRTRLLRELDEIDVEKKAAAEARAQKQGAIRAAALGLARALGAETRAADAEYAAAHRWNERYSQVHEISMDRMSSRLPLVPDLRKLVSAIVNVTGGCVAAHELFAEAEK